MNTIDLSKTDTSKLFELLHTALEFGLLQDAYTIANEMSRSARRGTCHDLVAKVSGWKNLKAAPASFLQLMQDRIDQYNAYAQ